MKLFVNKPKLNLFIDIIMFLDLAAIAGIGFLMKYVLIPGFMRNEVYGKNVELYFLGLNRHQWGSIHLILSFVLLGLLLLHIIFHWKLITGIYRRMFNIGRWRPWLASVFLLIILALALLPIAFKPVVEPVVSGRGHGRQESAEGHGTGQGQGQGAGHGQGQGAGHRQDQEPDRLHGERQGPSTEHEEDHNEIEVYGYMNLKEVSEQFGISCTDLAAAINVPAGDSLQHLGRLKRIHGFELDVLRDYIQKEISAKK